MEPGSKLAKQIYQIKYAKKLEGGRLETWDQIAARTVTAVLSATPLLAAKAPRLRHNISSMKFMPGGRFLAQAGPHFLGTTRLPNINNCYLLRAEDTSEDWARIMRDTTAILMSGGGVGIEYSQLRAAGAPLLTKGGVSSGPLALMHMVNEAGRFIRAGGGRRAALWAGLSWDHPDMPAFLKAKDWSDELRRAKERDPETHAPLDLTNISVSLNQEFFDEYKAGNFTSHMVYMEALQLALRTGEPGFSVNITPGKDGQIEDLRNPCCEVVSARDSEVCCLGSVNLAQIRDIDELRDVTQDAVAFLLAGTHYSSAPTDGARMVKQLTRRIGLGLLGVHEWLIQRGKKYGRDEELGEWLAAWRDASEEAATRYSTLLECERPAGVRAIAPTGTIGMIAETTTGIEPLFCAAYLRRFYDQTGQYQSQYVVDPVVRRLQLAGVDILEIEDSYALAGDVERRLDFQAWVQEYVDQAISSTINLPPWGSTGNPDTPQALQTFGDTLMKYLPKLRGITVFPDGCRGLQPLTPVSVEEALRGGAEMGTEDICDLRGGGTCGS